ncbi:BglG family transcription antiterminator LicT [Clostridium perfringens]|uniref:BglG family transcription antiterminator LicT n=1 Tax=Clostridium perfringens TaxID=1502 RepID=UPI0013E3F04C|nr:PRD domain-containing protein [Clostridium perfringens]MDM0766343.1 PRD domain-containing protein [Clostridium perfringens]NGT37041.1 PRD domain-containing protein [Clostridium perfringens]
MVIDRILNNNVVIIKDKKGIEQVVCGKGIAFKKKVGDEIDEREVNKVFILQDQTQSRRFQELVSEIPLKHLQVADEIIEMIKIELGKKINDRIYISLSDHIYTAIQRFLEGITITNSMLWDIKRFYELEFSLALKALDIIKQHFQIELPEDEAAFITLHIVNAETDESNIKQILEVTKIMQEISNIVKYYFSVEFDVDSVYYYRFITHIKFFAKRLVSNKTFKDSSDDELLEVVKMKYQTSYKCVERITEFILRKYKYELSNEEKLYLTIHIERVIYKNRL